MRFAEGHATIITMKHILMLAEEALCSHKRTQRTQKPAEEVPPSLKLWRTGKAGLRTIPSFVLFAFLCGNSSSVLSVLSRQSFTAFHAAWRRRMPPVQNRLFCKTNPFFRGEPRPFSKTNPFSVPNLQLQFRVFCGSSPLFVFFTFFAFLLT